MHPHIIFLFFFFNDTATTEIYTLSLHDALPIFVVGLLVRGPVNLDRAFEVRAVFDDDLRCFQIPNHRTVFLDLDLALRTHDSLHVSTHHYLAGNDVSCHVRCRSHCQLPLTELCLLRPFHQCADPRCRRFRLSHAGSIRAALSLGPLSLPLDASRLCSSWLFPPRLRSGLRRLIRLHIFRLRVRTLWRFRFLVTPHQTSLGAAAQLTNIVGTVKLQVSSRTDQYVPVNILPFALNVYPCSSLHLSNSLASFFSCSNADATASAPGMSGSAAT